MGSRCCDSEGLNALEAAFQAVFLTDHSSPADGYYRNDGLKRSRWWEASGTGYLVEKAQ